MYWVCYHYYNLVLFVHLQYFPLSWLHHQTPYFSVAVHRSPSPAQKHTKNRPMWGDTHIVVNTLRQRWTMLWRRGRRREHINTREWPLKTDFVSLSLSVRQINMQCFQWCSESLRSAGKGCKTQTVSTVVNAQSSPDCGCDKGHSGYKYLQWSR